MHEAACMRAINLARPMRKALNAVWASRAAKFEDKPISTPHMTCLSVTVHWRDDRLWIMTPSGLPQSASVEEPYGYDDAAENYPRKWQYGYLLQRGHENDDHNDARTVLRGFRDPQSNLHRGFTAPELGNVTDLKREIFQYADFTGFDDGGHFYHTGYISWPEFWKGFTLTDNRIPLMMGLHPRLGAESTVRRTFNNPELGERRLLPEIFQYIEHPDWDKNMKRRERRRGGRQRRPELEYESASKAPRMERGEEKDAEDMDE
jgi:hypothetical protein